MKISDDKTKATTELADGKAPSYCVKCGSPLCLRKQVINYVFGNTEEMFCLVCLAYVNGKEPKELLLAAKEYIQGRDCFRKTWVRYENRSYCPDPYGCFLDECFGE